MSPIVNWIGGRLNDQIVAAVEDDAIEAGKEQVTAVTERAKEHSIWVLRC